MRLSINVRRQKMHVNDSFAGLKRWQGLSNTKPRISSKTKSMIYSVTTRTGPQSAHLLRKNTSEKNISLPSIMLHVQLCKMKHYRRFVVDDDNNNTNDPRVKVYGEKKSP